MCETKLSSFLWISSFFVNLACHISVPACFSHLAWNQPHRWLAVMRLKGKAVCKYSLSSTYIAYPQVLCRAMPPRGSRRSDTGHHTAPGYLCKGARKLRWGSTAAFAGNSFRYEDSAWSQTGISRRTIHYVSPRHIMDWRLYLRLDYHLFT